MGQIHQYRNIIHNLEKNVNDNQSEFGLKVLYISINGVKSQYMGQKYVNLGLCKLIQTGEKSWKNPS